MDVKEAVTAAKAYVTDLYASGGERISNLGLEEIEYDDVERRWMITLAFSRPWNTPKTRAAEVLESMGATPAALKRSFKILTVEDDGRILSMKNRPRSDFE